MCAIVDANVANQVFGHDRPEAGERFLRWIESGRGFLVAGGRHYDELLRSSEGFRNWAPEGLRAGSLIRASAEELVDRETEILGTELCRSDDAHILALALVSGARLLYSNDLSLQNDFKNQSLINYPRGKVYSTRIATHFASSHRDLLNRRDLCRV